MNQSRAAGTPSGGRLELVASYAISRVRAGVYATGIAVLMGLLAWYLDLDLSLRPALLGLLVLALGVVVVLHEGTHGAAALVLGHRPRFGFRPPLVYVTFEEKIGRNRLIAIALAPLVVLDLLFVSLYAAGVLPLFSALCFGINSLGAAADIWIVTKMMRHPGSVLVQDTRTGVEIWRT